MFRAFLHFLLINFSLLSSLIKWLYSDIWWNAVLGSVCSATVTGWVWISSDIFQMFHPLFRLVCLSVPHQSAKMYFSQWTIITGMKVHYQIAEFIGLLYFICQSLVLWWMFLSVLYLGKRAGRLWSGGENSWHRLNHAGGWNLVMRRGINICIGRY